MGNSHSSNSRDYQQQLAYYPNFDSRPFQDQDYNIVEQKHLDKILAGEFLDLFEDEDVEYVWIYSCPLRNQECTRETAIASGSVAGVAGALSFVPGINLFAIPVAAAAAVTAGVSSVAIPKLNHQFVMIKTKKWLYVVAKGKGGCECFRASHNLKTHLIDTQKQYDQATRPHLSDPTPKVWKADKGKGRLFDMIRWMKNNGVIDNNYNWLNENCKHFAQPLFNLLAQKERC